MSSSVVARTSKPFKWWQSVGILVCFCLLVYGAFALWNFVRVSKELDKLKAAEPAVRQKAAEELGHSKSSRAVEPLIAALGDPDYDVQGSAATALGEIKDPRAVEPLLAILKADTRDNRSTIGPLPEGAAYAGNSIDTRRYEVAKKAAEALGNLGSPAIDGLMAALKDKLSSGYAAAGLVKVGAPAVDALAAAMKDPDEDVRWQAANALGEIKDPRAVPALIEALQVKGLQWHAAFALGEIKDARAVEPLIAALQDKDAEFREEVARALGEIKDPRADAALTAALKDPEPNVIHAAANALGQIGDPQAVNVLLTALREHNAEIIAGAGNFFIKRGEPGTEDALIEALNKSGDKWLAEDMMNSGNEKLSNAANDWASSHNYEIRYMPGARGSGWGEKQ
ncbi:MAG: HEAT repeat domain-containing protein [Terracidiphilus sp.]|jgi:HEAT repeat protein